MYGVKWKYFNIKRFLKRLLYQPGENIFQSFPEMFCQNCLEFLIKFLKFSIVFETSMIKSEFFFYSNLFLVY